MCNLGTPFEALQYLCESFLRESHANVLSKFIQPEIFDQFTSPVLFGRPFSKPAVTCTVLAVSNRSQQLTMKPVKISSCF